MREERLWTWHVVAGVVVLVLLGLHMTIMHFDALVGVFNPEGPDPLAWANVVARAEQWFFLVSYVVLLGAALFHGLYGLRNVVFELGPAPGVKQGVNVALTLVGVVMFAGGTWAAWAAYVAARG
jgi:succinate dehydrogenase hydrophobic anchor subunit